MCDFHLTQRQHPGHGRGFLRLLSFFIRFSIFHFHSILFNSILHWSHVPWVYYLSQVSLVCGQVCSHVKFDHHRQCQHIVRRHTVRRHNFLQLQVGRHAIWSDAVWSVIGTNYRRAAKTCCEQTSSNNTIPNIFANRRNILLTRRYSLAMLMTKWTLLRQSSTLRTSLEASLKPILT